MTLCIFSPGEVSRMPGRTPDPVPGSAGLPYQRDPAALPGVAHRDHWRTAGPHQRPDHGAMLRVLGEVLLFALRALRQESLRRLQGRSHGHLTEGNRPHQQPGKALKEHVLTTTKRSVIFIKNSYQCFNAGTLIMIHVFFFFKDKCDRGYMLSCM